MRGERTRQGYRWLGLFCGLAILWGPAGTLWAQSEKEESYVDGALRKLGRGITNIATSPGEIIYRPQLISQRDGYMASVTVGVLQGVWHTLLRALAGTFEVATFYLEIPEGFGPLVQPEYIFETIHREGR